MQAIFLKVLRSLRDFIFPPRCAFCDEFLAESDMSKSLCGVCGRSLMRLEADFTAPHLNHVWFDRARSAYSFEGAVRDAIHKFKYNERLDLARVFAGALLDEALRMEVCDVVVPVPLHTRRLWHRGFNQASLVARPLATLLGIDCDSRTLIRTKNLSPQVDREQGDRIAAVKGIFKVRDFKKVKGKKIFLIDDVLTTGATVNECARVLKKSGAKTVNVLTIARPIR